MTHDFIPLPLQADWVLERYLGWTEHWAEPRAKLLVRRRGPLRQALLIARGLPDEEVQHIARAHALAGPLTLAVVVELLAADAAPVRLVAGRAFTLADSSLFFGVGTFVVDLTLPEDRLWDAIATRERSKTRQAQRAGVRAVSTASPSHQDLDALLQLYAPMARERNLPLPARPDLLKMASRGELVLCSCRDSAGRLLVVNAAYCQHGQAYFLHGARDADVPAGAGVLTQWELMRTLKARGLRDYDLGLVASTDESDGLFRFKRALGGTFVRYGPEYRRIPGWLRPLWDWRLGVRRAGMGTSRGV